MRHDRWRGGQTVAAVLFAITGMGLVAAVGRAHAGDDQRSIVAGRQAFERGARFPWYDAEQDTLRPLTLQPAPQPGRWNSDFGFLRPLTWGVLALALAALVVLIVYAVRNRGAAAPKERETVETASNRAAVEALPFLADRSRADLLGEARRYYQQGDYSEAIIYLFSYQLVELDKFALIRLAKGKTNRQYLREAAQVQPLEAPLELTMTAFEDVFFGRRVLDRERFEACFRQLPLFERLASRTAT